MNLIYKTLQSLRQLTLHTLIAQQIVLVLIVLLDSSFFIHITSAQSIPPTTTETTTKGVPSWQRPVENKDEGDSLLKYKNVDFHEEHMQTTVRFRRTTMRRIIPTLANESIIIRSVWKPTSAIIFLHGHGPNESGDSFAGFLEKVRQPYMKIICPSANPREIQWYNRTRMPAWFDFSGDRYPEYTLNSSAQLLDAVTFVHHLIEREMRAGVHASRIILGGYSQGAVVALHAGLSYRKKLAGIIMLSSWQPIQTTLSRTFNNINRDIAIFSSRKETDKYTRPYIGQLTTSYLRRHYSKNIMFKRTIMNHTESEQEYRSLKIFCMKRVPALYQNFKN